MARKSKESRRKTPWDGQDMTPTQQFIHDQHNIHYEQRHPSILESGEVPLINSYVPLCCPYCQSSAFMKYGWIIMAFKGTDAAHAIKDLNLLLGLYSILDGFLSASGSSIVPIYFAMSV